MDRRVATHPVAPHDIIDVVAVDGSQGTDARTEAEFVVRDEAGPLVVLDTVAKAVAVHKTSN